MHATAPDDFKHWFGVLEGVRRPRLRVPDFPYSGADRLREAFRRRPEVARTGRLFWGFVHLADEHVWSGEDDGPGGVVYSPDPLYVRHPDRLAPIAERLSGLHGNERIPPDPEWRYAADGERSGLERRFGERLPMTMTGGRLVFTSTVFIDVSRLVGGRLTDHVLPIWVDPDGYALVVPGAVWPPGFIERFQRGS